MGKNVLLVTNVFPPAIGGPAIFGARLAEALQRQGHHVTVLCATEDVNKSHTYPYTVIRAGTRGNRIRREIDLRARLLWAGSRADFTYCMGLSHQTAWVCRVLRKPFILRIGGDKVWETARYLGVTDTKPEGFYESGNENARRAVAIEEQRRMVELAQAKSIIYVSDYMRRLAALWSEKRPGKEYLVPNGIEFEDAKELPQREAKKPLKLLFVGRQTNWKGVDAILLALCQLEGVMLTVAGTGPDWSANVNLSQRLDLSDRVQFVGNISPEKMLNFMADHHVLLLPSLYEGLSNTLLEAGVAGLACIASNCGGNPEVITHGETGLLVDPFDIHAIVSAVRSLEDEEERIRLARNHRENVAENFNMDNAILKTMQVLEEV